MIKRRIEVTRETWRRIRVERAARICPVCQTPPELVSIDDAAARCGIRISVLSDAIKSGCLTVWPVERMVCLGCVKRLRKENT
jgi:formate dehydrogenase maturation protein FdhE